MALVETSHQGLAGQLMGLRHRHTTSKSLKS